MACTVVQMERGTCTVVQMKRETCTVVQRNKQRAPLCGEVDSVQSNRVKKEPVVKRRLIRGGIRLEGP